MRHRRLKWCPAPPCYLWIFASTRFPFGATGRETLHTVRVTSIHHLFHGPWRHSRSHTITHHHKNTAFTLVYDSLIHSAIHSSRTQTVAGVGNAANSLTQLGSNKAFWRPWRRWQPPAPPVTAWERWKQKLRIRGHGFAYVMLLDQNWFEFVVVNTRKGCAQAAIQLCPVKSPLGHKG